MSTSNAPKVILITGTSKGIGKELVEYYLKEGWDVVGCSRSSSAVSHPRYRHFRADVSNEEMVREIFTALKHEYGSLYALLNNAAIASMNHIVTTPVFTFENILKTNVLGSFLFTREAAKMMMKQKQGRIINFSSVASPLHLEGEAAYAASKAALENFTVVASKEFASFGITVNAIGFTPYPTNLIQNVPKEKINFLLEQQTIKRLSKLEDITNVLDFYLAPASEFITGQVLYLGGIR